MGLRSYFFVCVVFVLLASSSAFKFSLKNVNLKPLTSAIVSSFLFTTPIPLSPPSSFPSPSFLIRPQSAHAATTTAAATTTYSNERFKTSFQYPSDFELKTGSISSDRVVEAFVDPSNKDISISIVYNPIPADYSRLTSFGGGTGVTGKEYLRDLLMPRNVDGIESTLVSEKVKGETYTLEYSVSIKDGVSRHVQTVFALRPAECVVGLTIQSPEDAWAVNKEKLSVVLNTFQVKLD